MLAWYRFATGTVRLLTRAFCEMQVRGGEHVPADGPFLLIANHINFFDPPLLAAAVPRVVSFMAKEEIFRHPVVGPVIRPYEAFMVRRGKADREAIREAVRRLNAGRPVAIFIEGTRSATGELGAARSGAALIADLSRAPILPVAISGTEQLRSVIALAKRPAIEVHFGPCFSLEELPPNALKGGARLEQWSWGMRDRIRELLPTAYQGRTGQVAGARLE